MRLYYDQTEGAAGTLLPPALQVAGHRVIGLEAITGADLLLARDDTEPLAANVLRPPFKLRAQTVARSGLLIQRKTGMDFLGSTPNLTDILQRMLQASSLPVWLTPVGVLHKVGDDTAMEYAGQIRQSGWKWAAVQGALDAWQFRGGCIHWCANDEELVRWVLAWNDKKLRLLQEPSIVVERPGASLLATATPQLATLMSFPHIGVKLAEEIMAYCGNNLSWALTYVGSRAPAQEVKGVGVKIRRDWRNWLQLAEDDELGVLHNDREEFDLGKLLAKGE